MMIIGTVHITMTIGIMLSTTCCGDPIPPEDRLMMICFCYICYLCQNEAESLRKGNNKFTIFIILIILDLIFFIFYMVYLNEIFFLETLISFSLIILINIIFCALRIKMELFEDYDDNEVIENELNQNSKDTQIVNDQI